VGYDGKEDGVSKHDETRTFTVPWRRIGAALPAVALIGGGTALAANGQSAHSASTSASSRLVSVPPSVMEQPASPPLPPAEVAKGLEVPAGTPANSAEAVHLDTNGIPARALDDYRRAAAIVSAADPSCHIDWALLGAIGKIESNHARFGGNALNDHGVATPGIFGIALDGARGTARIGDTDGGVYDHDGVWDRAVGPMQFIPSTWRTVGSDADADGVKNPQSMVDAATSTAIYLCAGRVDLSQSSDLYGAVMRYNQSDSYVRTVIAIADAYRRGVTALPAASLPAAFSESSTNNGTTHATAPAPAPAAPATPGPSPTSGGGAPPAPASPGAGSPSTSPSSPSSPSGGGILPPILTRHSASTVATPKVSPTAPPVPTPTCTISVTLIKVC